MSKRVWLKIFKDLNNAPESSPRGQKVKELIGYSIKLHPIRDRFCSFAERNLNFKYLAGEFAWYLNGDRDDLSIIEYSKFWDKIKNESSPRFNSNYGYYIFKEDQFYYVLNTLKEDKDSRQAVIIINNKNVMMSDSLDKICTYSISFNIRKNKLNMIVNMRSNDVIRGFSIDVVMFSFIYEMLYVKLKETYPNLQIGFYQHNADSFHIYELHYKMIESILNHNTSNESTYTQIEIPQMTLADVYFLLNELKEIEYHIRECEKFKKDIDWNSLNLPKEGLDFSKWILKNLI